MDYQKYGRDEAPAILQFVHQLGEHLEVDFFPSQKRLLSALKSQKYLAVAISAFSTLELRDLLPIVMEVKKADPGLPLLMGGQGVTGLGEQIASFEGVDLVVEGEADLTLPVILGHLERKEGKPQEAELEVLPETRPLGEELKPFLEESTFPFIFNSEDAERILEDYFERRVEGGKFKVPLSGLYISTPGGVFSQEWGGREFRRRAKNLNGSDYSEMEKHLHPYPNAREVDSLYTTYPWEIVEREGYSRLSLYVQRGCNWNLCTYCSIAASPGRRVSPDKVLEVLEEAERRGIKEVTFDDDQFVQSSSWCEEILEGVLRKKLNTLSLGAMVRVDTPISRGMLGKMKEAGFVKLQIGVESFIPQKVEFFRKVPPGREGGYPERARRLVELALSQGIDVGVFIITTRPGKHKPLLEVAREVEENLHLAEDAYANHSRLPTFSFSDFLMAYPGAPLLEKEEYKEIPVPYRSREGERVVVGVLKVPYMFEFPSSSLLGFFSSLRQLSVDRGIPPEVKNETLEHIEDIVKALEITAESLDSEVALRLGTVYGAFYSLSPEEKQRLSRLLGVERGELLSFLLKSAQGNYEEMSRAVKKINASAWAPEEARKEAGEEKEELRALLPGLDRMLYGLEMDIHREVRDHMKLSREELKEADGEGKEREKIAEVRAGAKDLLDRLYPYYKGRSTLVQQLEWLEEYESSLTDNPF